VYTKDGRAEGSNGRDGQPKGDIKDALRAHQGHYASHGAVE